MVINIIRKYISLTKEFGVVFVCKYLYSKLFKSEDTVNKVIADELMPFYSNSISDFNEGLKCSSFNAWSLWWQGEDGMPEMVKICYQSHLKFIKSERVTYHLLTQDNISNYVEIPVYILKKVDEKKISLTHLSDIIRILLLEKYGGVWIDLTLLFNYPLLPSILNYDFFSFKLDPKKYIPVGFGQKLTTCKWTGFFLSTSVEHSRMFVYLKNAVLSYWKGHDYLIDYFLMNRFIKMAYDNDDLCNSVIDSVPYSNINMYRLLPKINSIFDVQEYETLCSETLCFKLSYKMNLIKSIDGKKTYYGQLYDQYFKK